MELVLRPNVSLSCLPLSPMCSCRGCLKRCRKGVARPEQRKALAQEREMRLQEGRYLGEVVGDAQEPPLDLNFLPASQLEPAEAPVVFQAPEHPLDFHATARTQRLALIREQVLPSLSPHALQFKAHLELAVAFASGALAADRAPATVFALVASPFKDVTALGGVELGGTIGQPAIGRAHPLIPFGVIDKIIFLEQASPACLPLIPVEGVVLHVALD